MGKFFAVLLCFFLFILSLLPNPLWADCVDFTGYNSYVIEGNNKIIFYRGAIPVAFVILQTCKIPSAADVRITKPFMCDSDPLIINGEECAILTLDSASSR